jgi:hypothetical protein
MVPSGGRRRQPGRRRWEEGQRTINLVEARWEGVATQREGGGPMSRRGEATCTRWVCSVRAMEMGLGSREGDSAKIPGSGGVCRAVLCKILPHLSNLWI